MREGRLSYSDRDMVQVSSLQSFSTLHDFLQHSHPFQQPTAFPTQDVRSGTSASSLSPSPRSLHLPRLFLPNLLPRARSSLHSHRTRHSLPRSLPSLHTRPGAPNHSPSHRPEAPRILLQQVQLPPEHAHTPRFPGNLHTVVWLGARAQPTCDQTEGGTERSRLRDDRRHHAFTVSATLSSEM